MPQTFHVGSRSWLVNGVAWCFIVLGAAAAGLTLLQSAALGSLLPPWAGAALPPATAALLDRLHGVLAAAGVLSLLVLAAGIGLSLRLEWARRAAIAVLLLAGLASLLGLWLQHELVQALMWRAADLAPLPAVVRGWFDEAGLAARGLALLLTLGVCALLAGLARGLATPRVRQEFA